MLPGDFHGWRGDGVLADPLLNLRLLASDLFKLLSVTIGDLVHPGAEQLLPHGQRHDVLLQLLDLGPLVRDRGVQSRDLAGGFLGKENNTKNKPRI